MNKNNPMSSPPMASPSPSESVEMSYPDASPPDNINLPEFDEGAGDEFEVDLAGNLTQKVCPRW
jgi:hypothetical protein